MVHSPRTARERCGRRPQGPPGCCGSAWPEQGVHGPVQTIAGFSCQDDLGEAQRHCQHQDRHPHELAVAVEHTVSLLLFTMGLGQPVAGQNSPCFYEFNKPFWVDNLYALKVLEARQVMVPGDNQVSMAYICLS